MHAAFTRLTALLLLMVPTPTLAQQPRIPLPENADPGLLGGWACRRGFRESGNKCVAVVIPQNAELDIYGHGWTCKRGFQDTGGRCVAVVIPQNAELDIYGHGWTCSSGFKRMADQCTPMSTEEKRRLNEAVSRAQAKTSRVSSTTCEIDGQLATGIRAKIVFQRPGCDYFIADGPSGLYLIEWYGGHDPDQGEVIVGPINSYGFKDVCYLGSGQGRVWVDDYLLSDESAAEKYRDKCN